MQAHPLGRNISVQRILPLSVISRHFLSKWEMTLRGELAFLQTKPGERALENSETYTNRSAKWFCSAATAARQSQAKKMLNLNQSVAKHCTDIYQVPEFCIELNSIVLHLPWLLPVQLVVRQPRGSWSYCRRRRRHLMSVVLHCRLEPRRAAAVILQLIFACTGDNLHCSLRSTWPRISCETHGHRLLPRRHPWRRLWPLQQPMDRNKCCSIRFGTSFG